MRRVVLVALVILALAAAAMSGWAFALVSQGQLRRQRLANEVTLQEARTERQALTERITELEAEISRQQPVLDELWMALTCPAQPPEIDYTSNASVSESLKAYVEDTSGTVDSAEWDVVWANSRTAIHKVHGKYMDVFIVYFDEPDLGKTAGVFDASMRCWLDFGERE